MKMFPNCKIKKFKAKTKCPLCAENIHTTSTEGICCMTLPPFWIFQNQPPKVTPTPLWNF